LADAQTYSYKLLGYNDGRNTTTQQLTIWEDPHTGTDVSWATAQASYNNDVAIIGQGVYDSEYSINVSIVQTSVSYYDCYNTLSPLVSPGLWLVGDKFAYAEMKEEIASYDGTVTRVYEYMGMNETYSFDIDGDPISTPIYQGRTNNGEVTKVE
jgi:hypothetical protein